MITYSIDEQDRLIRVRMSGSCSSAELERHFADAYQDPRYNTSLRSLMEIDGDTGGPILEELPRVKQVLELAAHTPRALRKWAVVVPSGLKRTIIEFMLKDMRLKPLKMRFFDDEVAARAWLDDESN